MKTIQVMKVQIKLLKKTQTEGKLENKKLESLTKTPLKIPEMENRISGIEDTTEEKNTSVKENVKSYK